LIDLPSSYFRHVRGLCGNFNLKPLDDIPEAGDNITAVVTWAKSWKSADSEADDPICWDYCDGACPVCRCEAELGMVVCEASGCKAGEVCAVVRGVRRCVASSRSVCVATGDPHYTTFDGRRYDFMGTCVYLLAGLCSTDPTLIPFAVTVENNHRGSHLVSFTKVVTMEVYNMTLSLSQEHPQKVKVNGVLLDLPFTHNHQLQVSLRGVHGFITTDAGVAVTFDWHSYARVIIPSTYAGAVCGLCGNANGDPHDDFVTRQGHHADNETHLGDSWKVGDVPGCSPGCSEGCQVCSDAQKRAYRGDKHCGLLGKKGGPFAACHDVVDPGPYLEDCLFDACLYQGHRDTVCQAIGAYVAACQSQGAALRPWRTAAFCSPVCPPNQHYELCGPPCPPSCRGEAEPQDCSDTSPCSEGCFCNPGFFRSGDHCVPLPQCGCVLGGRYYPRGVQFYPEPPCTQRCVCSENGGLECHPTPGCSSQEECTVQDGVLGCHPRTCRQCQLLGAGAYSTFDGHLGNFGGSCTLVLLQLERGEPEEELEPVTVAVEQEDTQVQRVTVMAHGVTVVMDRGQQWQVTVDGERHLLPLWLRGGALGVAQVGSHRLLRVQGGPKILYDGNAYLVLTLPPPSRRPRGLCGNFNGDPKDDHPDGEAPGSPSPNCSRLAPAPSCSPAGARRCAVLADPEGPFAGCHGAVPPRAYLGSCERQVCGAGGDPCPGFQGYAAACQAAGGELREWREATGCRCSSPPPLPPKGSKSLPVCLCSPHSAFQCIPVPYWGSLVSFPACPSVPLCLHPCSQCPPAGPSPPIAETILTPDCSQSCTCRGPGGLQCRPFSCPLGHTCGLRDGARACAARPGRCALSPATRFVTFDGLTGATLAGGTYVVASVCDPRDPAWFRLLGDVRDVGDRPAVVALHLFTPHSLVTVRRSGKVWLNGVPTPLPLELPGALTVTETPGSLRISRIPGFLAELGAAGVAVEVPREARATLCGLCGDYDGATGNDLRGPGGTAAGDVRALAEAWRAPDFS
ncbi:FCGBP protein, partial [Rhadina sibilatrix]|nr:FCGBP protein [Rhadina sibilatrix]